MSKLRVSVLQCSTVDGAPDANLERALTVIDGATEADLYLLPELWTTGYAHGCWRQVASQVTPRICDRLQQECRLRDAWIGGSQVSLNAQGRLVNRFSLFGPGGQVIVYDKGHLFAPMQEPAYLAAGEDRVGVELKGWHAALSICFDLRFPEMYRLDALDGAELLLVVAAWPAERAETLRVLSRARAIENQAYLVLCNRTGSAMDGMYFGGGSMVVTPDGRILADAGEAEGSIAVVLDHQLLEETRVAASLLDLRRPGLDWDVQEESPYLASTPTR